MLDPHTRVDGQLYQSLIDIGFRRSGEYLYKPTCSRCSACVSVRVPVQQFRPNRSQRRCLKRNSGIELRIRSSEALAEHHALYCRYLKTRHPKEGEGEAGTSLAEYLQFLNAPWSNTLCYEFHHQGHVVAVAVTDQLPHGLSAVYTFFEPGMRSAGLGNYAVLRQIEQARRQGLQWVYLGFWIADCNKMNYKEHFRPLQAWSGHDWVTFDKGSPIEFESANG